MAKEKELKKRKKPDTPEEIATTEKFLQFLLMHAQNVMYVLGMIPGPGGGAPPPNLEAAKVLIDQLEAIKKKTAGNLYEQEERILSDALTNVQMAFVEASGGTSVNMMPDTSPRIRIPEEPSEKTSTSKTERPQTETKAPPSEKAAPSENKKKFFKSYG